MPVTVSANKALRRDRRRTTINKRLKIALKETLKKARKAPDARTVAQAASGLDKAAKKHYIHHKKADRLKARLAKLLTNKPQKAAAVKAGKKTRKPVKKITSKKSK